MSEKYVLRLYIMGETGRSQKPITRLDEICSEHLEGRYELEVINLEDNMQLAEDEKIFATPLLEKRLPPPIRRVIGDLSNKEHVLFGIDLLTPKRGKEVCCE